MKILKKNVWYNGNPIDKCAVQWESPPDDPSRLIKTYNQRRYRSARNPGKKHTIQRSLVGWLVGLSTSHAEATFGGKNKLRALQQELLTVG